MAGTSKNDKLVVRNIGLMLSGDLDAPILDADALVAENGRIAAFGKENELDTDGAGTVVDARGTTLCPGLIDSHVHPVAGDWTPRQSQLNWIDSSLNGGVTTMISAGEVHMPGRPKDIVGLKALAVASQRAFQNFRPNGVKVHAGAPVIEQGMEEQDFVDLADAGVKLLGEIGLAASRPARKPSRWSDGRASTESRAPSHTGGPSIPGSGLIDKDVILPGRPRHHRPHQRRPYRAARRPDRLPVRAVPARNRNRPQRQRARRPSGAAHRLRTGSARARHPGHGRPRRIGCAAARDPAHDRVPCQPRRGAGRARVLLCHGQHGAHAGAGLRAHRSRAERRLRDHGQGAAHQRPRPAGERQSR